MIDAATLYRNITANFFKALASEYLAGAGNVLDAHETIIVNFRELPEYAKAWCIR